MAISLCNDNDDDDKGDNSREQVEPSMSPMRFETTLKVCLRRRIGIAEK